MGKRIMMARRLGQSISKTASLERCSRSAVVSIYQKWSKEETEVNQQQGHGWPRLVDACWEQRLACVVQSNRQAAVAQTAQEVTAGSDRKVSESTNSGHVSIRTGPRSNGRRTGLDNQLSFTSYSEKDPLCAAQTRVYCDETLPNQPVRQYARPSRKKQVAIMTARIRNIQEHLHKHPKDKANKRLMLMTIDSRKKKLKFLRRTRYDSFMKVCQELGITYTFPPEYYRRVTRRWLAKKAFCNKVFKEVQKQKAEQREKQRAAEAKEKEPTSSTKPQGTAL
ncbi:28S ribosomal protein S15, mitochondrial [Anabarilius grahami]|uniref:Small ribosomal subunit protein uS15m n=1 Tax=Anabarilius grahami TaxID=495550 RepID=A0A3N0XSQ6_ANAGA|nr:28S ribosomal protein S15, mitochondrial [Anabarilius grahami]